MTPPEVETGNNAARDQAANPRLARRFDVPRRDQEEDGQK